jgi:hypothetical protein
MKPFSLSKSYVPKSNGVFEKKEVSMSKNSRTHYYLYAKRAYQKKNIWDDLRIIQAKYTGSSSPLHVSKSDIMQVVTRIAMDEMERQGKMNPHSMQMLLNAILKRQQNAPSVHGDEMSTPEAILRECLAVLLMAPVKGLNLGEPDSNILPVNKGGE